jgi:uncharacterized protein (TIGR00369 family)
LYFVLEKGKAMYNPNWEKPMKAGQELPFTLESWVELAPYEKTLGMVIESSGDGEAVLTMPFLVKHCQGKGLMHGGALTSLADTAAAMAIKTLLPESTHFVTVSMSTDFLAPVREGTVRAEARAEADPERERTYLGKVNVADEEDTVVATFESVFKVARP